MAIISQTTVSFFFSPTFSPPKQRYLKAHRESGVDVLPLTTTQGGNLSAGLLVFSFRDRSPGTWIVEQPPVPKGRGHTGPVPKRVHKRHGQQRPKAKVGRRRGHTLQHTPAGRAADTRSAERELQKDRGQTWRKNNSVPDPKEEKGRTSEEQSKCPILSFTHLPRARWPWYLSHFQNDGYGEI